MDVQPENVTEVSLDDINIFLEKKMEFSDPLDDEQMVGFLLYMKTKRPDTPFEIMELPCSPIDHPEYNVYVARTRAFEDLKDMADTLDHIYETYGVPGAVYSFSGTFKVYEDSDGKPCPSKDYILVRMSEPLKSQHLPNDEE